MYVLGRILLATGGAVSGLCLTGYLFSRTHPKLVVCWDLDKTIIYSKHITTHQDKSKWCTTVSSSKNSFVHIDDDLMEFKTQIRPYTRLILQVMRPFATQVIFTAASRGYMHNVKEQLDPHSVIFSHALSINDFPKGHLREHGKDVREFKQIVGNSLKRAILIDDKVSSLKGSPTNGILAPTYKG